MNADLIITNNTLKTDLIKQIMSKLNFVSLHTDTPDITGSNELSSANKLYYRQPIQWNSIANSSISQNGTLKFIVEQQNTITYLGIWENDTVFTGFIGLPDTYSYDSATGYLLINSITITF
jgi:hypothetical protein